MRHRGTVLVAGLLAALAVQPAAATAANTNADCGYTPKRIWQAFLPFGDRADYWLAPGGDFETGTQGWTLRKARVVWGNDTTGVLRGARSIALGGGLVTGQSEVVSPPFCVSAIHPTFRYVLKANGAVGLLSTFIRYQAADGTTQEAEMRSRTATTLLPGKWKPSTLQPLATKLPMASMNGVAKVQLVFRTPISALGSSYQIDNVLVDPYRTR
ncbi:MAG: hypothetical protein JHD16_09465 [Solirubrobacteraceae bacterium]|nr:hypothetical protein [Solirubrobacteraceae bacterium]